MCRTDRAKGESNMRSTTGTLLHRSPSWSRTARPVSRLARSSLVTTATAAAFPRLAAASVWGSVASAMMTGTPSARSWPSRRLPSSLSTATTSRPASTSCWMTRVPTVPRPITMTCPCRPVIRCRPSDSSMRRLTIMLVSVAKNTATNVAPSSMRQIAASISHGSWPRK